MCGRFAITSPPEAVRAFFRHAENPNFPPRYNIAPTQPIPLVSARREGAGAARHFQLARWGFLPGFVKNPAKFPLIINARIKPHHAPVLEKDPAVEKLVDKMGEKGSALYGII